MQLKLNPISVFILFLFVDMMLCQRPTPRGNRRRPANRRGRPRGRRPPEPVVERINCYSCYVDFTLIKFNVNNTCYNLNYNVTLADFEFLTQCPAVAKYCQVDIHSLNGGLLVVDRRCGSNTCRHSCVSKGYGVERKVCTYCCGGKMPEDDDEYDDEVREPYKCP